MSWLGALTANRQRGSYPRCLLVTVADRRAVAERLESIVALPDVQVCADDRWMPCGPPRQRENGSWDLAPTAEAELGRAEPFLTPAEREAVMRWWLAVRHAGAKTPNWDIASTCTVEGRRGLLLVEAKAHGAELHKEDCGKLLERQTSAGSRRNHDQIGTAIAKANCGLARATGLDWRIARDSHYQLANRFAWSWKLASLGLGVVLVYLGFCRAEEMRDRGLPFADHQDWEATVRSHAAPCVPSAVWNRRWTIDGQVFLPLIRSCEMSLHLPAEA
jgi:hypothetical protein